MNSVSSRSFDQKSLAKTHLPPVRSDKKTATWAAAFVCVNVLLTLFAEVVATEFLLEFLDTASRVNEFLLAGEEWVTGPADFHVVQRVFLAIFPLYRVLAFDGRAGQETVVRSLVLEDDETVIVRVNFFFHG